MRSEEFKTFNLEELHHMSSLDWSVARNTLLNEMQRLGFTGDLEGQVLATFQFAKLQRLVVIARAEEGTRLSCDNLIDSLP